MRLALEQTRKWKDVEGRGSRLCIEASLHLDGKTVGSLVFSPEQWAGFKRILFAGAAVDQSVDQVAIGEIVDP